MALGVECVLFSAPGKSKRQKESTKVIVSIVSGTICVIGVCEEVI